VTSEQLMLLKKLAHQKALLFHQNAEQRLGVDKPLYT
jgi:hypothetical protein